MNLNPLLKASPLLPFRRKKTFPFPTYFCFLFGHPYIKLYLNDYFFKKGQ